MWIDVLRKEIALKGCKAVAQELGYARSTVALLASDKYPGGTAKARARVEAVYGVDGPVVCASLGRITVSQCRTTWQKARIIGMRASNPDTLRLYKACMKCTANNT